MTYTKVSVELRCAQDWKLKLAVLYALYNGITCGT